MQYQLVKQWPYQKATPSIVIYQFESFTEMLKNPEKILHQAKIPKQSWYNLHFTIGKCKPGSIRQEAQELIPFDIDKMEKAPNDPTEMYRFISKYVQPIADLLNIDSTKLAIIWSGKGLHVYVLTEMMSLEFLLDHQKHYKAIVRKLNEVYANNGLSGKAENNGMMISKTMRYPGTKNKKHIQHGQKVVTGPGVITTDCRVIMADIEKQNINWSTWEEQTVTISAPKREAVPPPTGYKEVQPEYVMEQCGFLADNLRTGGKWAQEPEWFAALSVVGHFPSPVDEEYAHAISNQHDTYDPQETAKKLEQVKASGTPPRTCDDIAQYTSRCSSCQWRGKVRSPITLSKRTAPEELDDEYCNFDDTEFFDESLETATKEETNAQENEETVEGDMPSLAELTNAQAESPEEIRQDIKAVPTHTNDDSSGSASVLRETKKHTTEQISQEHNSTSSSVSGPQTTKLPRGEKRNPEKYWHEWITLKFQTDETNEKGKVVTTYHHLKLVQYLDYKYAVRYIPKLKRFIVWQENYWQSIVKDEVKAIAAKLLGDTPKKVREEFWDKFINYQPIQRKPEYIQKYHEGHINLKNGILRVSDMELLPHSPKFYFDYILPYDFDLQATCPTWDQLLENIACHDDSIPVVLNEYLGYILNGGKYQFNDILVLSGSGANGKTTLINAFREVTGPGNCASLDILSLSKPFVASFLEGKLLNVSEEESPKCFTKTQYLKKITGDGTIYAERKFEAGFELENRAKLIMTYNTMPFLNDISDGMKRRLSIVECKLDLTKPENSHKKIPNVIAKIKSERSGILNRALAEFKSAQAVGKLSRSLSSDNAIEDMIMASNPFEEWFKDYLWVSGNEEDFISSNDLWDAYRQEFNDAQLSKHNFFHKLKMKSLRPASKFFYRNKWVGENRVRGYQGVTIRIKDGKILPMPNASLSEKNVVRTALDEPNF